MYETLDELWPRLPNQASRHEYDDGSGWAVYAARWYEAEFDSMLDFVHFCFAYSSVMQFVIPKRQLLAAGLQVYRDEIAEYFVPNEAPEALARQCLANHQTTPLDATHWLAGDLHFVDIPWLKDRDHDRSLVLPGEEYSELYSFGKEGYLNIFVVNC